MEWDRMIVYILLTYNRVYNPLAIFMYLIILRLINCLQYLIIWILYNRKPPYSTKVQIKKIIYRQVPDFWNLRFDTDFLGIHKEFQNPKCVLDKNVHIYNIDENIARFVRISPNINIYDSSQYPFVSWGMMKHATHVYEMPVDLAIAFSKDLDIREIPVTILAHTGRCGSTLLANIFTETGRAAVLSIPEILGPWNRLLREGAEEKTIETLIRCGFKFMLRSTSWNEGKYVCFIKPHSHHIFVIPLITKIFPNIKVLFLTRKGLNVCRSFQRIDTEYWPEHFFKFPSLIRFMIRTRRDWMCMRSDLITDGVVSSQFTMWVANWATKMQFYSHLRKTNDTIQATSYEDIVQHRAKCIAAIFEYCGLDPKLSRRGEQALDYKSQKGLWNSIPAELLTRYEGRAALIADKICDQCEVPRIGDEIDLPGQLKLYEIEDL